MPYCRAMPLVGSLVSNGELIKLYTLILVHGGLREKGVSPGMLAEQGVTQAFPQGTQTMASRHVLGTGSLFRAGYEWVCVPVIIKLEQSNAAVNNANACVHYPRGIRIPYLIINWSANRFTSRSRLLCCRELMLPRSEWLGMGLCYDPCPNSTAIG